MWILIEVGIGMLIIIFSLQVIAMGQLLLAIRQVSLNTGRDTDYVPQFKTLEFVSILNNFVGWVGVIVGGLIILVTLKGF